MVKAEKHQSREMKPARTPEQREKQLIALAVDLAEQRLRDGTASSAEIVHFLKLASPSARIERENLQLQNDLIRAKVSAIETEKTSAETYDRALKAMTSYSPTIEADFEEMD
jgi:uncharacterized protein YcaQ